MLPVTVWMNMPSFHQSDLLTALAASGEIELRVVFARPLSRERLSMGWQDGAQDYDRRFLSGRAAIPSALRLAWSQRDRLHILGGMWSEPAFTAALCGLIASGARYAIYSEAVNPWRKRPEWKKQAQARLGRITVKRAAGLLPVGQLGVDFYLGLGAQREKIYPFGYFRALPPEPRPTKKPQRGSSAEVIFIGQLIERKGIDILLEALAPLVSQHQGLILTIVGGGDWRERLRDHAERLGIAYAIRFEGVLPSSQVLSRIARADLLVLPSRWDGWGMVVNEAFMAGVPVLVSDSCGAAELVCQGRNGYVFRSGDPSDLTDKLSAFLGQRNDWPRFREEALATGESISAETAGGYLIRCLQHMLGLTPDRPQPPWRKHLR